MKRTSVLGLVLAGAIFCLQPNLVLAQGPGGGAQGPAGQGSAGQGPSTPPTMPSQTPGGMGQNPPTESGKPPDNKFVKDAAMGGMLEVELGKVATQKASNPEVKQFAQKMVDDHTKANEQLKEAAGKDKVEIPDSLDSKHQGRLDKLSKLSGDAFDKAYVKDQLKDHESDVKAFQNEAQSGADPDVKAFASSTLPTLQQHLEMVKNLNKSGKDMGKQPKGQ